MKKSLTLLSLSSMRLYKKKCNNWCQKTDGKKPSTNLRQTVLDNSSAVFETSKFFAFLFLPLFKTTVWWVCCLIHRIAHLRKYTTWHQENVTKQKFWSKKTIMLVTNNRLWVWIKLRLICCWINICLMLYISVQQRSNYLIAVPNIYSVGKGRRFKENTSCSENFVQKDFLNDC